MKVETMLEEKEKKGKTIETYSPIPIGFYDNWIGGGGRGPQVESRKDFDG